MSRTVRVKRLAPPLVPELPRCSALLSEGTRKFWRGRPRPGNHDGGDTCGCRSSYRIAGKPYCAKHAGIEALKFAVDAGRIEIVS